MEERNTHDRRPLFVGAISRSRLLFDRNQPLFCRSDLLIATSYTADRRLPFFLIADR